MFASESRVVLDRILAMEIQDKLFCKKDIFKNDGRSLTLS